MGIDAKNIQVFVCKFLKLSLKFSFKIIQKHPFLSTSFLFLFSLYFFLPRIFIFLIYSSPILACTFVFIKFHFLPRNSKIRPVVKAVKSELHPDDKSCNVKEMEASGKILLDRKNQDEGIKKEKKVTSSSRNVSIGEMELENSSSDDEEEEIKEAGNKAVEWNENDQKNLMDLGISELERNKRLESLIARRRVRKLFKMQTEKILISSNFYATSPVIMSRGNPFDVPLNPDEQGPGSAPSVMLPTRNPFDLPYDPYEEKPDLMGDSFQQEFMPNLQKDLFFCRHDSFTVVPAFPMEGVNDISITPNNRFRKLTPPDKGEHDLLVDHLLSQQGSQQGGECKLQRSLSVTDLVTEEAESSNKPTNQPEEQQQEQGGEPENSTLEMNTKTLDTGSIIEMGNNGKNGSSSSSVSSDSEQFLKPRKPEALTIPPSVFRFPAVLHNTPNSAPCKIPKAVKSGNDQLSYASPATIDRSSIENHLLYTNNGPWHTPTHSIASDMQVEVSEIGSPPLTGDGSASSNDGESYDGEMDKEIVASGSDEMWGAITSNSRTLAQNGQNLTINNNPENKITSFVGKVVQGIPIESVERAFLPPEGFFKPPKVSKCAEEVNMSYNVDVADDFGGAKSVEEKSESIQNTESNKPLIILDHQFVDESKTGCSLVENRKAIEDLDARIEKYIEQEVLVDLTKRAEENTSEEKKENEEGKENFGGEEEVVVGASTSRTQQETAVEQVSNNSSSCLSPKSILPNRINPLPKTLSDINDLFNLAVSESEMEERTKLLDEVRSKVLDEQEEFLEDFSLPCREGNLQQLKTDQLSVESIDFSAAPPENSQQLKTDQTSIESKDFSASPSANSEQLKTDQTSIESKDFSAIPSANSEQLKTDQPYTDSKDVSTTSPEQLTTDQTSIESKDFSATPLENSEQLTTDQTSIGSKDFSAIPPENSEQLKTDQPSIDSRDFSATPPENSQQLKDQLSVDGKDFSAAPPENLQQITDQPYVDGKDFSVTTPPENSQQLTDRSSLGTKSEEEKLDDGEANGNEHIKSMKNGDLGTSINVQENSTTIEEAVADNTTTKEKSKIITGGEIEPKRLDKSTESDEHTSRSMEDTKEESRNLTEDIINDTIKLQAPEEIKSSNNIIDHVNADDDEVKAPNKSEANDGKMEAQTP